MTKLKKTPLISILVNCYNGEKFLYYAIKSILDQSYKNWEIIFFDNKSSDNSLDIIKKFKNKKIKIFINKTKNIFSLYKARNLALKKTKGDLIAFLDTDDTWNK
ncbi:MAG: glycosyltransferase family A protein, partial [Pseudomonadota bacterium]|nr:glycosyltransferase family A protein [Pseudomonadota bacterium]